MTPMRIMQGNRANGRIRAGSRLCLRGICTASAVRWWFVRRPSVSAVGSHRLHKVS